MECSTYGLTDEQIQEIKCSFNAIDKNNDGRISCGELMRAQQALGLNPTKQEATDTIKEVDQNGSGYIELDEYITLMSERYGALEYEQQMMESAFRYFDKDQSGHLSKEELHDYLCTSHGEPLSEEEFNDVLSDIDQDGDGKINLKEFVQLLVQRR